MLTVRDLRVRIGEASILRGVDLDVARGETVGLVGESGSGKSMTALAAMGLPPRAARVTGDIALDGEALLAKSEIEMQGVRGARIGMVFQEPMTALNPVKTIGAQIAEGLRLHLGLSAREAEARARETLDRVGLPAPRFPLTLHPHQLSGGQRQRVVIAIAIACAPDLVIADEPTTALDVTVQAQILDLLTGLVAERHMGLLLITHDLAVISERAARVAVMKDGAIVETGPTNEVIAKRRHPYTRSLFAAATYARTSPPPRRDGAASILSVQNLVREYALPRTRLFGPRPRLRAVDGVDLEIAAGASLGLVGESGCGKSTLARAALALERPQGGRIRFLGRDLFALSPKALKAERRHMQMVFQDPYGSFDPRHRVARILSEPFATLASRPQGEEARARVVEALRAVGLADSDAEKYPHEFSGGQRQRIAIARALITEPQLIVADEPVSALDVSIRAQVLDLMLELQARLGLAYLFISHDLSVVRAVCDEVAVMRAGRIVERGPAGAVFDNPQDPYTASLVAAAPRLAT